MKYSSNERNLHGNLRSRTDEPSDEDLIRCQAVKVYVADFEPDAVTSVGADKKKRNCMFQNHKEKGVGEAITFQKAVKHTSRESVGATPDKVPTVTQRMRGSSC